MKHLTIIRHAKSSWAEEGISDVDRPLNERGRNAIPLVAKYLVKQHLHPDFVLTSPATRAMQTATDIAKAIGFPAEKFSVEKAIYYGDSKEVFELLLKIDNTYSDVLLFGHEPKLSGLIALLTGEVLEKFPTCAAYRISFNLKTWEDIRPKSGKCEFFVNPKLLGQK